MADSTITVEFDPAQISFADLQDAFQKAAQVFQAADTEVINNGGVGRQNAESPLTVRRFNEDLYIISGYSLPDPAVSPVTKRLQAYNQNPLIEAHRPGTYTVLTFQHGRNGNTGITMEALLSVVLDRLQQFQAAPYACDENDEAIWHLNAALAALNGRMLRVEAETANAVGAQPENELTINPEECPNGESTSNEA